MERLSDLADEAERIESALLAMQIAVIRQRSRELNLDNQSGLCWHCDNETGMARRFCSRKCADLWEKEQ